MPFTIEHAKCINAQHLQQPVFMIVKEVDGKCYFDLKKSDRRMERLLVIDDDAARSLPRTSIIETISELISKEFWSRLKDTPAATTSVGCRMDKKAKAKALMIQGDPAEITIDAIEDIPSQKINILMSSPSSHTVMVELCEDVLVYLTRVIGVQLRQGDTYRKRQKKGDAEVFNNEGIKGISKDYAKNRIRAVKVTDGATKNKYFAIDGDGDEEAVQHARSFLRDEFIVDDSLNTGGEDGVSLTDDPGPKDCAIESAASHDDVRGPIDHTDKGVDTYDDDEASI
jgi:hypothetical protein